jgi:hypothetical protein
VHKDLVGNSSRGLTVIWDKHCQGIRSPNDFPIEIERLHPTVGGSGVQAETRCRCGIPGSTSDSLPIVRPPDVLLLRLGVWTVGPGTAGGVGGGPGSSNDALRTHNRSSSFERAVGTEDGSSSVERATRTEDGSSSFEGAARTEDSSSSLKRAEGTEDSSSSLE